MASVEERTPRRTGDASRPPGLPLVMDTQEFGLPLDEIRIFLEAELRRGHLVERQSSGQTILFDPQIGRVFGERLAVRMESLLSRPGCRFANGYMRQDGHGARVQAHLDREPLDVTMSIPIVCEGCERWPLWVEQPDGSRFEWAGTPGTVLIMDGKWRLHGRDAFEGTRSVVLLLHWTAPAVLWPGFLDEDARGGMGAGPGFGDLAGLAVPGSMEPEMVVWRGPGGGAPEAAVRTKQGAECLVPLDAKATVHELDGAVDGVALRPGDGIAFPAGTKWRIRWHGRDAGKMLFGRAALG